MPARFSPPVAEPAVRTRRALDAFLAAVDEEAEPALARIAGDLSVEIVVAVPPSQPLNRRWELDNLLLPVVLRLGQRRVPAVFARKVHADVSTLTVAPASHRPDDEHPMMRVRAVGSSEEPGWREQVREACEEALAGRPPYAGTATLHVGFAVSSLRNWTTLWKPAIDAIAGPLLGVPDPENPWSPRDDHVTELGLHRTTDDRLGYDVEVSAWWLLHP